jgi:hypothetical protein
VLATRRVELSPGPDAGLIEAPIRVLFGLSLNGIYLPQ